MKRFSTALVLAILILLSVKGCEDGGDEFPCGDCTWNEYIGRIFR